MVAKVARLGPAFGHRVSEGAEAAEGLAGVKESLEMSGESLDPGPGAVGRGMPERAGNRTWAALLTCGPEVDAQHRPGWGSYFWLESIISNVRYFVRGSKFRCRK